MELQLYSINSYIEISLSKYECEEQWTMNKPVVDS